MRDRSGPSLDECGYIVAAALRHPDVGQHDVGTLDGNAGDGLFPIPDSDHLHVLTENVSSTTR